MFNETDAVNHLKQLKRELDVLKIKKSMTLTDLRVINAKIDSLEIKLLKASDFDAERKRLNGGELK